MLLDKFPDDSHRSHQSWLRGSVVRLKKYLPEMRYRARSTDYLVRGNQSRGCSHSPSPSRKSIVDASQSSSISSQDHHRSSPSPLDVSSAVRTPRVPGDEAWRGETKEEEAAPLGTTFEKEGLSMKVPDYLTKLSGASRDGMRAVPHLKPPPGAICDNTKKKAAYAVRRKPGTLATVTVPVSAKQWLLQAIGLKDSEIREMFDQMESNPQLAAEYVREVRAEWEAMETKVNRVPIEADFLVKDRALLEKVRELILRFIDNIKHHQESEVIGIPLERKVCSFGDAEDDTVNDGTSRPSRDINSDKEIKDELLDSQEYEGKVVCSTCGHLKESSADDALLHEENQKNNLPSFIPVKDYVINKYVVQPELLGMSDCKSTYSPSDKRWHTVLFPALQPAKREDVQLLWSWLHHATQRNSCENPDGRFQDVEAAFVLHSIAFLEIVRQVDIHCEERGNMLLHLWRQLLRIFNQVMVRAEPTVLAAEDELKRLRNDLQATKDKMEKMMSDYEFYKKQYETFREQLRMKDAEISKIKRCRLCCTENMSPRSREIYIKKLKQRSISNRYTESVDFTLPPPTEEELKRIEEERRKKQEEEELKKQEDAAAAEAAEVAAAEAEMAAEVAAAEAEMAAEEEEESKEEVENEKDESESKGIDVATQTDIPKGLRRCSSAPPDIFPPAKAAAAKAKKSDADTAAAAEGDAAAVETSATATTATVAELNSDDLKALSQGWVEPAQAVGGSEGRLKEFEDLAVDTIGLLDRLPMEGALAEKIELLLTKYCELTGTDLEKARQKFMKESKVMFPSKRSSVMEGVSGGKVSFMEGRRGSDLEKLKKGRRSKASKWGLQLKSYVPLGFAKMMKIYNPPKNVKFFNVRQLTKLIASVCINKVVADSVDDSCNNERQTCCEFVYDFMLNQYGLKGLSESAIFGVFKTVKTLMTNKEIEKHHKVRMFGRFVGMDEPNNYSEPDLYLYLKLLQKASAKVGVLLPSDQDDGLCFLNASQFSYITDEPNLIAYFGSQGAALSFIEKFVAKHAITEKASPEIRKIVKESEVRKVDWDLLMEAILAVYPHKMDTIQEERRKSVQVSKPVPKDKAQELENLFVAGDANQDGVLTFSEFSEIVTTADSSISAQSAIRMFRETLLMMPDGGDSISPQAFAQIAYNHGIEAPSSVVFELLRKTWAQVQGDIDNVKVEEKRDEFEFTKEALLDLMHQKVDVNSAVQMFRQFVLNFCVQEEAPIADEPPQELEDEADSNSLDAVDNLGSIAE